VAYFPWCPSPLADRQGAVILTQVPVAADRAMASRVAALRTALHGGAVWDSVGDGPQEVGRLDHLQVVEASQR
jgi:hypothetical protein